jgi:hypothetical protein
LKRETGVGRRGRLKKKIILPLPGIEPIFFGCPTNSLLATLTVLFQHLDTVKKNKTCRDVGTEPSLEQRMGEGVIGRRNNLYR